MKDAYSVLGVSRDATDEQIKTAYRELARKYHPDSYQDNPLADLASEKMQEINEAYDTIMNERRNRTSGGYSGSASSDFADVRRLINEGRLEQAQELLDGVAPNSRTAEWYFLNGTVLYRRGWFDQAYTSFVTASRMDPNNAEYRTAVSNAEKQSGRNNSNPYRTYGGNGGDCSGCDVCSSLLCADCCCECMGGDLIRCC